MPEVVHITTVHNWQDPRILARQLFSLRKRGYSVGLIAQAERNFEHEEIEVIALPAVRRRLGRIRLLGPVWKTAIQSGARVFHIHDPELIPVLRLLKVRTGSKVVYDVHEDYAARGGLEGWFIRRLECWAARWADAIVVADDDLERKANAWGQETVCIRNYIKPIHRQPSARRTARGENGRTDVVYTGVISTSRGLQTLIRVAKKIDELGLNVKVRIKGVCYIDAERIDVESDLRMNGVPHSLEIEGWATYVPHDELLDLCREAHLSLALWLTHNDHRRIPTKFYEYVYYGLPVICSDLPCWREFIQENNCGLVVDVDDAEAVIRAIERYIGDPELYQVHSAAALQTGMRHTWSTQEPALLKLYEDLIGAPSNGL